MKITDEIRDRITTAIAPGLVSGLGQPEPGQMCVEAAICWSMGEPHGDRPTCVASPDRDYAVAINDSAWSSPAIRAKHMLPLALAQLGTAGTDRTAWEARVLEGTIRRVLPLSLRAAARVHPDATHQAALIAAADRCDADGTREAARSACNAANAARSTYNAVYAAYAADANAAYAACAAANAAYAYAVYAAYADAASLAAALAADDAYADAAAAAADDLVLSTAVSVALDAYAAADAADLVLSTAVSVALDAYAAEGRQ